MLGEIKWLLVFILGVAKFNWYGDEVVWLVDGRSLEIFIDSLLLAMEGCKVELIANSELGGFVPWTELSGVSWSGSGY